MSLCTAVCCRSQLQGYEQLALVVFLAKAISITSMIAVLRKNITSYGGPGGSIYDLILAIHLNQRLTIEW